jgi:hypothetical protein
MATPTHAKSKSRVLIQRILVGLLSGISIIFLTFLATYGGQGRNAFTSGPEDTAALQVFFCFAAVAGLILGPWKPTKRVSYALGIAMFFLAGSCAVQRLGIEKLVATLLWVNLVCYLAFSLTFPRIMYRWLNEQP